MRKGFTILEILVVLAIIGLLTAAFVSIFGGFRVAARDDRRVADLRQVQGALQLFFLKCGFYPGEYDKSLNDCKTNNPSDWKTLTENLKKAEIGFDSTPNDPIPGLDYDYRVQIFPPTSNLKSGQCYILRAQMETEHRSLEDKDDVDDIGDVFRTRLHLATTPNFCKDAGGNYCLVNFECKEFVK